MLRKGFAHAAMLLALLGLASMPQPSQAVYDPCKPIQPVRRGQPLIVGLAFWPGGTEADWGPGNPDLSGLNPCNASHHANLTDKGVYFATFNARVDKLTVLKTTYPEELFLTSQQVPGTPLVISVVAFRAGVRSDVRYVASFDKNITQGTGFVATLSLMAKFQMGTLELLQWYNLTCNDCGGRLSNRCINGTSCSLPESNCTCADTGAAAVAAADTPTEALAAVADAGQAGTCNYANMSYCATSVNMAFEGLDSASAAFTTASMVKKLNSYSLVALYYKGRDKFQVIQDYYSGKAVTAWGQFQDLQSGVVDAYSGNAAAGRTTGTADTIVVVTGSGTGTAPAAEPTAAAEAPAAAEPAV